ncbi:HNH endonuclease [Kribbella qitaiheensis]|uniref:HNH endonuclease n=2 Tax=Kribbella qitaiheensis TaxID=1544730 RepID=A0A7G6XA42_9ACTN|nr:HNH endonuclease [Kribbella qitaiheensis]
MASLHRAAARYRRNGDSRTTDQLCSDIVLGRLLPRTKRTHTTPIPGEPIGEGQQNGNAPYGDSSRDPFDGDPPVATEPPDDYGYKPVDDLGDEPFGDRAFDHGYGDLGRAADRDARKQRDSHHGEAGDPSFPADRDLSVDLDINEAAIGAEATVVIHATGAEVGALINGEVATGGEVDHHGPIPQSSLRKHLINALAQRLLPNLRTTPNSRRPGTTVRPAPASNAALDAARGSGARIELRMTDRPPPSDPDRYTPSAALDRFVRLRDRTCQFPGCNRPAEFTDVDHRVPFAAGGRTTADNLWCLCRHHHRLKHEGGWEIHSNVDGSCTWISPTGRRYRNSPVNYEPPPERINKVAPTRPRRPPPATDTIA